MDDRHSGTLRVMHGMEVAIDRVLTPIAIVILVVMVALVAMAVAARYLFNAPLVFSYDLSPLLFAWIVFLGLYTAERDNTHISLDIVIEKLPPRLRHPALIVRQILLIAIAAYIAWIGVVLIQRTGMQIPSMRISVRWLYASLPVGFGALALIYIMRLPRIVVGRGI